MSDEVEEDEEEVDQGNWSWAFCYLTDLDISGECFEHPFLTEPCSPPSTWTTYHCFCGPSLLL